MPKKIENDDNILNDFDELEDLQPSNTSNDATNSSRKQPEETEFEEEAIQEKSINAQEKIEPEENLDFVDNSVAQAASNVPVNVSAIIGKTTATVRELLEYKNGTIIDLHRSPGETVDIVAGGRLIARGELVDIDGRLGVKILKVLR